MGVEDQAAGDTASPTDDGVDFFVSYTGVDQAWAEWVAWQLEKAGYSTKIQAWDFGAGAHFVTEMHQAARVAARTVTVLSVAYLSSAYAEAEWQAAWAADPTGRMRKLLVFRIEDCPRPGLFGQLVSVDLFGIEQDAAVDRLVAAVRGQRAKPTVEPLFPGGPVGPAVSAPGFPGRLPDVWGPVPARNLLFTGRDGTLAELHTRLADTGRMAVAGLQGLGGVGKTQLAVEYAWRYRAGLDLVWWVDAETLTGLESGLADLATELGVTEGDVPARARRALTELGRRQRWLLIYDNIPDPATLASLLPPATGRLLITCRDPAVRRVGIELVEVGEFTRTESIALLRSHVADLTDAEADGLANAVGDLPLAVEQAGAYVASTGMPPNVYLAELAATPDALLDEQTLHHPGLTRTVAVAAARLVDTDQAAAVLLHLMAFFAPEPIPLTSTAQPNGGAMVLGEAQAAHSMLGAISRLALGSGTTRLRIHRLVQALLRARLTERGAWEMFGGALRLLATARPGDPENPANWASYAALAPHVTATTGYLADFPGMIEPDGFRALLIDTCRYLLRAGQAHAARSLAIAAQTRWTTQLGPDHLHTLSIANLAAATHASFGQYEAARMLAEDTLDRRRRVLGDDHPDTLTAAANLAAAYTTLGQYEAARTLAEDTLDRRRRVLGNDHPDTLASMANLVIVLAVFGDQHDVQVLGAEVLARRRRVLGDDHPNTLISMHNLAVWSAEAEKLTTACDLGHEVVERRRQVLGPDHPDSLDSAHNLGTDLARLDRIREARALLVDTLTRRRRVLGKKHPETQKTAQILTALPDDPPTDTRPAQS